MELQKVRELISEKMGISPDEIGLETTFEDLQIDSLDMVEIVMDIEEEFDISVDTGEQLKTVEDLVEYIKNSRA